ncbi:MAG: rhomboid family intramembrane serine protease [Myxococcales bacterium]|nr:rhomboid family intramembrane serine protease [Myxococcales bacterium]
MRETWYRILVGWYRLMGHSKVQAEWRARRALEAPDKARAAAEAHQERVADARFTCVCGQLLVEGDRTCGNCGRRQYMPMSVRRALRALGLEKLSPTTGTVAIFLLIALGAMAQLRYRQTLGDTGPAHYLASLELGAAFGPLVFDQPWRAFTYTLLHGGIMHILFNGLALYQIGPSVERRFGTARYVLGYVVTGALAVWAPYLLGFEHRSGPLYVPVIGASGAICGLLGMATITGHLAGTAEGKALRDFCIRWMVYVTIFGLMLGSVAHDAHFGGYLGGVLFGYVVRPEDRVPARRRATPALAVLAVLALVAPVAAHVAWHARGARPAATAPELEAVWYELLVDLRGVEAALGPDAAALVAEGKRVARGEGDRADYIARVTAYLGTLDEPQRRALVLALPDELVRPRGARPMDAP